LSAVAFSCYSQNPPDGSEDRLVLAAAIADFGSWKEVTFGNLEGYLALEVESYSAEDLKADDVLGLAPNIRASIAPALAAAYAIRNRSKVNVRRLFEGLPGARVYDPSKQEYPWQRPKGSKAVGSVGLPGYSANGSQAILQIQHSWSIHSAVVTYVLERTEGTWHVVARDQSVFL
jgi:hypothetical protein